MIVDSSALVAIILAEPRSDLLFAKINHSSTVGIGAPTLAETAIVLSRRLRGDPRPLLMQFIRELDIEVVPFTEEHSRVAQQAYLRFGKGRHPAALNFGDCLTYAVAATANEPLLYVGNDYARTDLTPAEPAGLSRTGSAAIKQSTRSRKL